MDALVAEKVMGWVLTNQDTDQPAKTADDYADAASNDGWYWSGSDHGEAWEWQPSTDIAAAWEVVEKLRAEGWLLDLKLDIRYSAYVRKRGKPGSISEQDTAPHAICLAALRAVGVLE